LHAFEADDVLVITLLYLLLLLLKVRPNIAVLVIRGATIGARLLPISEAGGVEVVGVLLLTYFFGEDLVVAG